MIIRSLTGADFVGLAQYFCTIPTLMQHICVTTCLTAEGGVLKVLYLPMCLCSLRENVSQTIRPQLLSDTFSLVYSAAVLMRVSRVKPYC